VRPRGNAAVGSRLRTAGSEADAAPAMTSVAVEMLPGADFAGMTRVRPGGSLITRGATAPLVDDVDRVHDKLGAGSCVDALTSDRPVLACTNRKLRDVALRIVDTGEVPLPPYTDRD
jgi:hypothetical protein